MGANKKHTFLTHYIDAIVKDKTVSADCSERSTETENSHSV